MSADAVVAAVMKWGFSLTPSLHMALWFVLPALTFCTLAAVVSSLLKRLLAPSIKPSAIEHWGKCFSYPQNQWITFGISKVADEGVGLSARSGRGLRGSVIHKVVKREKWQISVKRFFDFFRLKIRFVSHECV